MARNFRTARRIAAEALPSLAEIRFHDFRRWLANKMLDDQASLPVIQELLDHSDIATTLLYLNVCDTQVRHYAERAARGAPAPAARRAVPERPSTPNCHREPKWLL